MSDLCPYELQRLENIKTNNMMLKHLGLEPPPTAPAITNKKPSVPRPKNAVSVRRQSLRTCGRPAMYTGLSDELCLREEREAEVQEHRVNRRKSIPIVRFCPSLKVRKEPIVPKVIPIPRTMAQSQSFTSYGPMSNEKAHRQIPYYTAGEQGRCNRCEHWFVINKTNGQLRKHRCSPNPSPSIAVLPSM